MRQHVACFGGGGWIDRDAAFVYVLDDALLVDDECGSIAEALFFVKDSVISDDCSFEITEQWKRYADVLRETPVGRNAVNTDSENLGFCSLEFGDISLIRLKFFRSTAGECQHIEGQHHVFLAAEIAQLHLLARGTGQSEIRRGVAYL